jgi:hypothetical protein
VRNQANAEGFRMTARELVIALNKLVEQHGDADVYVELPLSAEGMGAVDEVVFEDGSVVLR